MAEAAEPVPFEASYEWQEVGASVPPGMQVQMPMDGGVKMGRIPPTWQLCVVGRCSLTVSNPVLKAPTVSALETGIA